MNNTLQYKWYIWTVNFSNDDKTFFWKVWMINDLVTFEWDNIQDLEKNFQDSVNDYLETCKKISKTPEKTFKWIFNLRIHQSLHKKAYQAALKKWISLNKFVEECVESKV